MGSRTTAAVERGTGRTAVVDPPAPAPEPRRPGRPRDPAAGRNILEATLVELAEHGAAKLTIEAVAQRAGVSKATIYRRWASKEDLVVEAASSLMPQVALPDTGSLRDDLVSLFQQSYEQKAEQERTGERERTDRIMAGLFAEAALNPDVRTLLTRYSRDRRRNTRRLVEAAIDRGELPASTDADLVLELIGGALLYRVMIAGSEVDHDLVERSVDIVLAGVRAV